MKIQRKRKRGHIAGRKDPTFGIFVRKICMSVPWTQEELTIWRKENNIEDPKVDDLGRQITLAHQIPPGTTYVDTLYGQMLFNDAKLFQFINEFATILQEFDACFWEDFGSSICDLRRDFKNRVWGDDQTILNMCYVAIAMGLADWSYPRKEWKNLPGGMPFIRFLGPKRGEKLEDVIPEGETNEQEQTEQRIEDSKQPYIQ